MFVLAPKAQTVAQPNLSELTAVEFIGVHCDVWQHCTAQEEDVFLWDINYWSPSEFMRWEMCQPAALISCVRTGGEGLEMLLSCFLWRLGSWLCCLQSEASMFLRGIFVWNNFDISNGKTSSGVIPMSFEVGALGTMQEVEWWPSAPHTEPLARSPLALLTSGCLRF